MVHLGGPGEAPPAGFALTTVEEEGSGGNLVESRELLSHQGAHGHVGGELALEIGERGPVAALLTICLGEPNPARSEDRVRFTQ
eukprot:9871713-Alexandrium_andersonii.AAC.1